MFCIKCGKEMSDDANFCPACGFAIGDNLKSKSSVNNETKAHTDDYSRIKDFSDAATAIKILGILSAALMFGIGIIFSIIIWVRSKKIVIPEITTTNPEEIVLFESAKRKYNLGKSLAGLPLIAIGISFFIGILAGVLASM